MKKTILLIGAVILISAGCRFAGDSVGKNSANNAAGGNPAVSAKEVMEKYMADAEKGDIESMTRAYANRKLQTGGTSPNNIMAVNREFSDLAKKIGAKEKASIVNFQEKPGDSASKKSISFDYGVTKNGKIVGESMGCFEYQMELEENQWRIGNTLPCL